MALKAWLAGALQFTKVPTTHTQAPEVPVCGWWAKGKHDGAVVAKKLAAHANFENQVKNA